MLVNCFSVALTSAIVRASTPMPGEENWRQNLSVAVPGALIVPFVFSFKVKLADAGQLETPLR